MEAQLSKRGHDKKKPPLLLRVYIYFFPFCSRVYARCERVTREELDLEMREIQAAMACAEEGFQQTLEQEAVG